jgi:NADH dehydrogenase
MRQASRIVVLGAGFGGMEAVIELEERFRDDPAVDLLLLNETNFFLFTPLLPQVVSSYIEPRHIVQSIRDIRRDRDFRFLRTTVTEIDLKNRRVISTDGNIPFDYLIIALGSAPNFFDAEGSENVFTLRTLQDGILLRDHLLDLFEHADHEPDAERKRQLLSLVVVGGGYTGVELAAELRDLLYRHVGPRYRGISLADARLRLLEAGDEILRGVDPYIAKKARRKLEREGIEVRTKAPVARISPGQVELKDGEKVDAGLVVWTAGVRAHPLLATLPVKKNEAGRLVVTRMLHLPDHPRVFAIGDNAVVQDVPPEQSLQIAPVAIQQARIAAENVARGVARQTFIGYAYEPRGMLVSLGMNDAVVNIMGFKLSGYWAWLLWNAVHLVKLVGLKKQLQVAFDWGLAQLFPRDTSIIRPPHRCRFCLAKQQPAPAAADPAPTPAPEAGDR